MADDPGAGASASGTSASGTSASGTSASGPSTAGGPTGTGEAATPNPAAPNPAGPEGRGPTRVARRRSRTQRVAAALPDWMGSIRFRLTALYTVVLFSLAGGMVLGLYLVLAQRLDHSKQYLTYVDTLRPFPGGIEISRHEVLDQARLVEHLANERSLALLRTYSFGALGFLFVASLLTGWLVAGRVLRPIGRITSVAREIQATDLSRRIALPGPHDELVELADTFDAMLARLDEAFGSQQRFIQEASHELRNPLAIIRTNLEVTLADPNADAVELRRVAELVQRTSSRMNRLVDDLLVYGRRGSPVRELEPVDLGSLVRDAGDDFAASASARSLRLDLSAPEGVTIVGDRLGLRQAVTNLLANAVRLAPEGSMIYVHAGRDEHGAWLAVADEGPGIAPEDRPKVFDRFWRGDPAGARRDGRSGLGLAIVDRVVHDHGGTVEVGPTAAGGSVFTLRFPADPSA